MSEFKFNVGDRVYALFYTGVVKSRSTPIKTDGATVTPLENRYTIVDDDTNNLLTFDEGDLEKDDGTQRRSTLVPSGGTSRTNPRRPAKDAPGGRSTGGQLNRKTHYRS